MKTLYKASHPSSIAAGNRNLAADQNQQLEIVLSSDYQSQGINIFDKHKETSMSIEKHDLVHEFPELRERIHELKTSDHHFAKLFTQYHDVDHEVHRLEQGSEVSSEQYLEARKKVRLQLKDQLYSALTA